MKARSTMAALCLSGMLPLSGMSASAFRDPPVVLQNSTADSSAAGFKGKVTKPTLTPDAAIRTNDPLKAK